MRPAILFLAAGICLAPGLKGSADTPPTSNASADVDAVDAIGMTVGDMDRAVAFYTDVLSFQKQSDVEVSGRAHELASGVFGARQRIVRLRLGRETIELTEYLAPRGRPMPDDVRPNDRIFQHIAIIVRDMDEAYAHLRKFGVEHASSGPQRVPDWNPNAGGIRAFYFRDPDRHFLEILEFPPGKGESRWQADDRLFVGVDHTAIVVDDTERSLRFYRDLLGLSVAGESENYDVEQEHLNGVFGARLRITAVRAARGPGIEFLEYLAPRDGRPAPADLRASDIGHWETTLLSGSPGRLLGSLRSRVFSLVSPGVIDLPDGRAARATMLVRDPDGHGVRLSTKP
jgi:catechol 2,3-dioxygenase-like lactoylglutathione lyase family enzyme